MQDTIAGCLISGTFTVRWLTDKINVIVIQSSKTLFETWITL